MTTPDANHPIAIVGQPGRVRVILAGETIAETGAALRLTEANYPPVLYIPREDIRSRYFVASARTSHCPYKGDARYFDLVVGEARRPDAVWSYETPFPAVAAIAGHVAFYPDRVDAIETE
jgi:uncharacterized protein (DUF427 family)